MKEHPIIFRGPMVRAILAGRKTQTRRVVRNPGLPCATDEQQRDEIMRNGRRHYGHPGDRLWVRETWAGVNTNEGPAIAYRADHGAQTWRDFSTTFGSDYGAGPSMDYDSYPANYCMWIDDLFAGEPDHKWKPSIHMPRWASRITLEVTGVRVERLQDINDADADDEGLTCLTKDGGITYKWGIAEADGWPGETGWHWHEWEVDPIDAFRKLWESINGEGSWDANPWVWVIQFRRCEA